MHPAVKPILANVRSPLFFRIAAGVFVCILLIEAILLIHSWSKERNRLLSQMDSSIVALTLLVDRSDPKPQLEKLLNSAGNENRFNVVGYAIGNVDPTSGGESNGLVSSVSTDEPSLYSAATGRYNKLLFTDEEIGTHNQIRLRIDASWINEYMTSYVWRILFMIVLISLFVTAGCLLLLNPLLIKPLQRLNQLMVRGREQGIRFVEVETKDVSRTDELGSVFQSFNILRKNLIESENSRIALQQRSEDFANFGADCFWELDKRFNLIYLSGDVERLLSVNPEHFIGRPVMTLLSDISPQIPDLTMIVESLKLTGKWEGLIQNKLGSESTAIKIIASANYSSKGRLTHIRGTIIDVNEQVNLANKLRFQASHDELTGLYNRRELSTILSKQIIHYQTSNIPFCYAFIDLDRFKVVNDTCGHAAGDRLLQSLADILLDGVDENDYVARTGGDEFALVLAGKDIAHSTQIVSAIRARIEEYRFHWDNVSYSLTASIGLAEITSDLLSAEAIAYAADSCCMMAKDEGKNQIRVFSSDEANSVYRNKDEAHWIAKIKNALTDNHFVLFKQDIVKTGLKADQNHFEVLIRMQDDDGSFCSPGDFLPVAERNGMMPEIDSWVISHVGNWFSSLTLNVGASYCVSVNLSPASLASTPFREFLLDWASTHQNCTPHICFEVTESAAMTNLEETIELLEKLRHLGCRIALDDFGTGFSSLAHIRELPLDYIKIDGSFVRNIEHNELDRAVVKSVADIARILDVGTIAEFVETEAMLSVLTDLQIDFAQGYLFSKPEPLTFGASDEESVKAA